MTADFKSHVLRRDEKGFGGIPFKRLLFGGVGGGLVYTVCRFALPDLAVIGGLVGALSLVILTGTRGGLPLWQRAWLGLRGRLLIAAQVNGLAADFARLLNVPVALAQLDGDVLFASLSATEIDLREWVTFARFRDDERDDGLVFVESPLIEGVS